MSTDFHQLERGWMAAVQQQNTSALEQLLDERFVCTAWSSRGELTTRSEYLASVTEAVFGCFEVRVDHQHVVGDTAIVRCLLQCDCMLGDHSWRATFLVTDVWVRRGPEWKAVSRHASVPLGQWPSLFSGDKHSHRNEFAAYATDGHIRAEGA